MNEPQTIAKPTQAKKAKKGFTLVELVAVMAIIGILAMMIIPQFGDATDSAKAKSFENTARTLVSQATMFIANNNGKVPSSTDLPTLKAGLPADWDTRIADGTVTMEIVNNATTATKGEAIIATLTLGDKYYVYCYDLDNGVVTKGNAKPSAEATYTPTTGSKTPIPNCWAATGTWGKKP